MFRGEVVCNGFACFFFTEFSEDCSLHPPSVPVMPQVGSVLVFCGSLVDTVGVLISFLAGILMAKSLTCVSLMLKQPDALLGSGA